MHPGQLILNRYRLENELGSGGMGTVWLAVDQELDCYVAMKRAHAVTDDGTDTTQLEVEAGFASKVAHTNIVMVHGVVGEGQDQWLVMEYFQSRSLAEIIEKEKTVKVRRVIHFGLQIAEGLEAIHRADFVHGDVKPANILVNDAGMIKLSDFGISRKVWNKETLTLTGPVFGTPPYMAPETLDGNRPSPASDVFALGATLFAAVEGVPPFGPEGALMTTLRRAALDQREPMNNAGPLGPLLASMLATEPAERPTMASVKRMLRELRDAAPVTEQGPGAEQPPTPPLPPPAPTDPTRRPARPWIRISLVAGAVILLAAGVTTGIELNRAPASKSPTATKPPALVVNQRTADPCALTNAALLAGYGDAEVDPHYENFNRCDVIVQSNNYTVDMRTSFADADGPAPTQPGAVTQTGAVGVEQAQSSPGSCLRTLLLADNTVVIVDAEQESDGNGNPNLCAMTQSITNYAVGVINHSGVPQRKQPFDPASLANLNACELLTANDLTAVPTVDGTQPDPGFGDWQCDWSGSGSTHVGLRFDQSEPLGSSDGQEVPIGNRAAFVSLDDGGCEADLVYRTYSIPAGGQISELVNVEVDGSQPQSQQCDMAKQLAADVGSKLPG